MLYFSHGQVKEWRVASVFFLPWGTMDWLDICSFIKMFNNDLCVKCQSKTTSTLFLETMEKNVFYCLMPLPYLADHSVSGWVWTKNRTVSQTEVSQRSHSRMTSCRPCQREATFYQNPWPYIIPAPTQGRKGVWGTGIVLGLISDVCSTWRAWLCTAGGTKIYFESLNNSLFCFLF